jgi:hypothetical protein
LAPTASGLPCATEAMMASVSRKSTLSRVPRRHTRQARRAIGRPFHSISGMLSATTNGLVEKAMASDSVGNASGDCAEKSPGTSDFVGGTFEFLVSDCFAGDSSAPAGERLGSSAMPLPAATIAATSARLDRLSRARIACRSVSRVRSYSTTRQAQS